MLRNGMFDRPVVDELGRLILAAIERAASAAGIGGFRKLPWPEGLPFAVALTHDQDHSVRWKRRLARHMFDLGRGASRGFSATLSLVGKEIGEGAVAETVHADRIVEQERARKYG